MCVFVLCTHILSASLCHTKRERERERAKAQLSVRTSVFHHFHFAVVDVYTFCFCFHSIVPRLSIAWHIIEVEQTLWALSKLIWLRGKCQRIKKRRLIYDPENLEQQMEKKQPLTISFSPNALICIKRERPDKKVKIKKNATTTTKRKA